MSPVAGLLSDISACDNIRNKWKVRPVGAKHAAFGCVSLDVNAKPSCNKICCDGQKQRTQSKKDTESYSSLEKFSWSSPGFVGLPMDAAKMHFGCETKLLSPAKS